MEQNAVSVPDGMQLDLGAAGKSYAASETAAVSNESKQCDALSTALFVMGLEEAV